MAELETRKIKRYGWKPDLPDHRDYIYNLDSVIKQPHMLPTKFSVRDKMPPVYDQGQLGSCTGNGIAAVLEEQELIQGQPENTPSRLFIYYGERVIEHSVDEDAGAEIRDGMKVVSKKGACAESTWPYDIEKFADKPSEAAYKEAKEHTAIEYKRVIPGTAGSPIRTPLSEGHPVVFGFTVYDAFEENFWKEGDGFLQLPTQDEGILGGHCTVVTGWDFSLKNFPVNVFEVRNSWGDGWGEGGYFYMDARWLYEPQRGLSSDFWVVQKVSG